MLKLKALSQATVLAAMLAGFGNTAQAAQEIQFDPDGAGGQGAITILSFDWAVNNALAVGGNPSGGLQAGTSFKLLSHARLASFILPDGALVFPPAGTEFTFVAGFTESVVLADGTSASFVLNPDPTRPNFFEIWVGAEDNNVLAGTGYNNGKRILHGLVTASSGGYNVSSPAPVPLDQFATNNYPAITTVVGSGTTQLSGVVISVDPDYFPNFDPSKVSDLKIFFNTSTVTPYQQANPSANFVGDSAGADGMSPPVPSVAMNVGTVNGGLQSAGDLNFILQADANQSFELGEVIPGTCRVTYGGNDRNGNIAPGSFGQACGAKEKGKANCYTFGGQVGAPTANPALGGPFGEHTHHQVSGPAGDFVFRAGSRSAPKTTRITATACKDPGAIQPAAANATFKQIDFEGTGSFRTLSAEAKTYLIANGAPADIATDNTSDRIYYFRVDMVDAGEPGNKGKKPEVSACEAFLNADQNNPLPTDDPRLLLADGGYVKSGGSCADVYQFYVCPSELPCEQGEAMYSIRAFLTGGNIQLHKVIK